MNLFDAHCHLQDPRLADGREAWLAELGELALAGSVVNGTSEADWEAVEAWAAECPWVVPAYGLHPWFASARSPRWETELEARLDRGGVIGEIGLDRAVRNRNDAEQESVFRRQLALAATRNLPVTIHCVRAWEPLLAILDSLPPLPRGFLLHGYCGPHSMIERFEALGGRFSFNGAHLSGRRRDEARTFRDMPADRILVETDAPNMPPPEGDRRWRLANPRLNHPGNIVASVTGLAEVLGIAPEAAADLTTANARGFFGCAEASARESSAPGKTPPSE